MINFPDNPTEGQSFTSGMFTWVYTDGLWVSAGRSANPVAEIMASLNSVVADALSNYDPYVDLAAKFSGLKIGSSITAYAKGTGAIKTIGDLTPIFATAAATYPIAGSWILLSTMYSNTPTPAVGTYWNNTFLRVA